ncbi:MAG: hypothetical protein AAB350_02130 [Patescibacteria group bacterium]
MKENNYASASELFRDALRVWEDEKLYKSIIQSKREFAKGKYKRLISLKDLM